MIAEIITFVLLILLGILLLACKGPVLKADYKAMSGERQIKWDKMALFLGKMMFVLSSSLLLIILGGLLEILWMYIAGIALLIIELVFISIYELINAKA